MRKFLLFLFSITLTGCVNSAKTITFSSLGTTSSSEMSHDYSEISNMRIDWDEIFDQKDDSYYVYIYSRTCSHCVSIKNKMIKYALTNNGIYFVEDSEKIVIKNDINYTIGLSSAEKLAILGFPSLLKITKKILTKNIAGTEKIINELKL